MVTASVICAVCGIASLAIAAIVIEREKPLWLFKKAQYLLCSSQVLINLAVALLLIYYIGQANA